MTTSSHTYAFVDHFPEYLGFEWYIKKPQAIRAVQYPDHFVVQTLEGDMRGKPNDYIVEGVAGEIYPCDRKIFEKSYGPAQTKHWLDVFEGKPKNPGPFENNKEKAFAESEV